MGAGVRPGARRKESDNGRAYHGRETSPDRAGMRRQQWANAECDGIVYRVGPDDRGAETACQASLDIMLETHTRDYQELVDGIKWDYERYRYDWEPDWSDDMAPEYVPLEYERIA